jgi:hypothetical protein
MVYLLFFHPFQKIILKQLPKTINYSKEYLLLIFRIINNILIDTHFNDSQNTIF